MYKSNNFSIFSIRKIVGLVNCKIGSSEFLRGVTPRRTYDTFECSRTLKILGKKLTFFLTNHVYNVRQVLTIVYLYLC